MSFLQKLHTNISEFNQRRKNYHLRKKYNIASLEETIDKIIKDKCSISRFGDGEIYIMEGKGIGFQKADNRLSERLKEVAKSTESNHLVCISNAFNPKNYREFTKNHIKWMKQQFLWTTSLRLKYFLVNKKYYNLLISRFWIPYKDKKRAKNIAKRLKNIWKDRKVVVIEGEKTRMGVGNDLLKDVKSCERILCPATDAFDKYDEILSAAKTFDKDVLFLIALGPTATVLAYDLYKEGYQALDIGHVDIEYEWMRLNADSAVVIENKFVNEVSGGDIVEDCKDKDYLSQIKFNIR